ncbi:unnamed protein product [Brassica rapa subsp. trilocularis]
MRKERMREEEEEPLSPMARVFQSRGIDYCAVTMIGFKTKIKPAVVLDALKHNVYKHPRFSSKLSSDGAKWIETEVNVKDHVVVPYIDPEEIGEDGEGFIDNYTSRLTMNPMDRSRPLWDIHILNVKTSDAEAVGVVRTHHTLGDGTSMVSLLLSCTHKTSDHNRVSTTIPSLKRRGRYKNKGWFLRSMFTIGSTMTLIWNTIVDMLLLFATLLFLKDTRTHIKGGADVGSNPKRFYHRTISLDDIKLIKNAMNMTINDVLVGITQVSLSSYLSQHTKNEEDGALIPYPNNLPGGIQFRAGCTVNLRSEKGLKPLADMMVKDSKCRWGNYFSYIVLPFSIGLQSDPLVYLKLSKSMMDRKKHSYHAHLAYMMIKICQNLLGAKVAAKLFNRTVINTTTSLSNVIGPMEEISFDGNPITYIATSGYGHSQRPAKKKGAYPLKPGVQGFFISCDGGREHQASQEAINVIDSFFEELMHGTGLKVNSSGMLEKPVNKKVTFSYSDDEDGNEEDGEGDNGDEEGNKGDGDKTEVREGGNDQVNEKEVASEVKQLAETKTAKEEEDEVNDQNGVKEPPRKKACTEEASESTKVSVNAEKSIDKLIDAELKELGDKSKRRFMKLDPGCNGIAFIQMKRRDGDPSPKDIVQHGLTSAAATKKHISRFILRLVPIEVSCYPSEEEISRAIKTLVEQYFPVETDNPRKFAVLYGARANTGVDRMKIINAVAKSIPAPHKVDLSNPEMSIVVEIVKTVCLIGVVEKYKELAKYNLRQLTSTK